jgi:thiol:disulfide interchange protein DsbG
LKTLATFVLSLSALIANICAAGNWAPAPQGSAVGLMQRLERANWVATGSKSGTRVVYVFTDPDCPYCNDLWKALRTARAPDVQIRYLLVAVIDADSRGKDAAILESKDPAATLEKHERGYDHGGVAPKGAVMPATSEILSVNQALMGALQIYGTPGLVFMDEQGQVRVFAGMPDAGQLRTIVGKR